MEQLKKIGKIIPKKSSEIKHSKISLGFEKLGEFSLATAKAIKEVNPDAKIIGGVVCLRKLDFLNTACLLRIRL